MRFASRVCMIGICSRREFCVLLGAVVTSSSRVARDIAPPRHAPRTVRIGVLRSTGYDTIPGARDADAGLAFGIDEAARTAAMFGLAVEFVNVLFSDDASHRSGRARHGRADDAARSLAESWTVALVGIAGPADAQAIGAVAAERRLPYVDVLTPGLQQPPVSAGNVTPRPVRDVWALYVAPPRPAGPSATAGDSSSVATVAWRHDLERYGAAQLNDRYRSRFGPDARMTGPAWAGWFAAKALVEACLRTREPSPVAVRDALLSLRFDGHKGVPLHFAADGMLQQPLYPSGGPS